MSFRIGLISDVHACPAPVEEAMALFRRRRVDKIICVGDIAGYNDQLEATVDLLVKNDCEAIIGNHDQAYLEEDKNGQNAECRDYLRSLPAVREYFIENKRIYVVHAQPPNSQHGGIKLLDENGRIIDRQRQRWSKALDDFAREILIVGHTHQVFFEPLGNTLVINPGSSVYNHSCAILNLPDLTVDFYTLSGSEILKSWNWSMLARN
ncbi:MAG: metallophosphatase family protein [Proteobacteria bacterium]|nr:metallophosphatase family protein [Pseudomonadota bacterium]MBU1737261.1 metallophosphatase family protein [Pseudomonadota bacterium]